MNPKVKELLKLVHICQSYHKNKSGPVFSDSQCITIHMLIQKQWPLTTFVKHIKYK